MAFIAFLGVAVASLPSPIPLNTTVCAVVQNPRAFNQKVVRFRAGVLTDWQHGIALIHSGCRGAIQLGSIDAVPAKQSRAFDRAVGTPLNPGLDHTAMATFTGRISWNPTDKPRYFDNPLKLDARRIENLKIYPRNHAR